MRSTPTSTRWSADRPRVPATAGRSVAPLNLGELYGIVHSIDGVQQAKILRMYETDLGTGEQAPQPAGNRIVLERTDLIASGTHVVKASHGGQP